MNQRNAMKAAQPASPATRRPVFWITEHQRVYPLAARFRHGGTPVPHEAGQDQR